MTQAIKIRFDERKTHDGTRMGTEAVVFVNHISSIVVSKKSIRLDDGSTYDNVFSEDLDRLLNTIAKVTDTPE